MPEWDQRVVVFVDVSNLYYPAVEAYGGHVDYEKLLEFVVKGRKLVRAVAYTVAPLDPAKEGGYFGFVGALKKAGYEVRERRPKILKPREENEEMMSVKANWDMGIAVDAISIALSGKVDVAALCSGDGDFADLAAFLRSHGVKVEVYSFKRNTAIELVRAADEFYDLDEHWEKIAYHPVEKQVPSHRRGVLRPMEERQVKPSPGREREEVLECVWMLEEEGQEGPLVKDLETRVASFPCGVESLPDALAALEEEGLIKREGEQVGFTPQGRSVAREIIRRHRLAERLLSDLLEVPSGSMEAGACRLEHALDPEVTDAVCTFLGHPKTCPHGKPIPQGLCCEKFERGVRPITLPLSELQLGERGRVLFITPSVHARLDRLASLGLVPGSVVKLHQKRPSVVVDIGETQLAIGHEIAREIYVRPVGKEEH